MACLTSDAAYQIACSVCMHLSDGSLSTDHLNSKYLPTKKSTVWSTHRQQIHEVSCRPVYGEQKPEPCAHSNHQQQPEPRAAATRTSSTGAYVMPGRTPSVYRQDSRKYLPIKKTYRLTASTLAFAAVPGFAPAAVAAVALAAVALAAVAFAAALSLSRCCRSHSRCVA